MLMQHSYVLQVHAVQLFQPPVKRGTRALTTTTLQIALPLPNSQPQGSSTRTPPADSDAAVDQNTAADLSQVAIGSMANAANSSGIAVSVHGSVSAATNVSGSVSGDDEPPEVHADERRLRPACEVYAFLPVRDYGLPFELQVSERLQS